jgi:hypothetical protein
VRDALVTKPLLIPLLMLPQSEDGANNHPSPRTTAVRNFLSNMRKKTADTAKRNHEDRGTHTLLDGYSNSDQLGALYRSGWELYNSLKGVRNTALCAVSHALLLRGDNVRGLDLADLFIVDMEHGAGRSHPAFVLTMTRSKTNDEGRKDFSSFLRHVDVRCCPATWVALYFFCRFDPQMGVEEFPDLTRNSSWFNVKVWSGSDWLCSAHPHPHPHPHPHHTHTPTHTHTVLPFEPGSGKGHRPHDAQSHCGIDARQGGYPQQG